MLIFLEARAEVCQKFRSLFWCIGVSRKIAFEIYLPFRQWRPTATIAECALCIQALFLTLEKKKNSRAHH